MKKPVLEIYTMTVCFVTLMCFTIALGVAIYDIVKISDPGFTLPSHVYERHQSNDAFVKNADEQYSQEKITRLREDSYEVALQAEKRSGVQSMVLALIIMLIDVAVFLPHWYIAKRVRESGVA